MQKSQNWMNRFRMFYSTLENKENIFYMFFTHGLLHWVLKSLSFVPREVNLVLLGCSLDADEIEWIENYWKLPFHHIEEYRQDSDVWDCLTRVNEYHFGWLDIDCFVLNPSFFGKMTLLKPKTFANTVWSIQNPFHEFMCTYFLFLNIDCVKRVNESGLEITPHAYNDIRVQKNISPDFVCKALGKKHKRLVSDVLKHKYDDNGNYQFDTLQLYQLAAEFLGYSVYKLTHLRGYISGNMNRYFSDDIIHIGAASHFLDISRTNEYPEHIMMLKLAYLLLCKYNTILPTSYQLTLKLTRFKLLGMCQSVNSKKMEEDIQKYFMGKNISAASIGKILNK